MAPDDEEVDDLYDDEFDFVDDDDEEGDDSDSDLDDDSELDSAVEDSAVEDSAVEGSAIEGDAAADADSKLDDKPAPREAVAKRDARDDNGDGPEGTERNGERDAEGDGDDEPIDDYSRPQPAANYRVHIYEFRQFKRTIDRPFTPEDAEAFASEFNRTSKSYGRFALAGKDDAKPRKALE
ncbi:MAG: hypothetical protein WD971_14520 [Pirellulales bacterium]